jgi:basic membrane protein A and related proteins
MRTRSLGLTLVMGLSIVIAACTSGSASPSAVTSAAPAVTATAAASAASGAPSTPASAPATSNLKIGVVTDIGTLDDKNYNEYTYKGVQAGAAAIGAANPPAVVPKDASQYATDIQAYIDQKFDVIVTVGFNLAGATTAAAHKNPNIWFIGVDQSPICVDATGAPDATFACKGKAADLLPKYISINFQEDQAGYLAGIISASVSKTGILGAIGGTSLCGPCIRYIQGYVLGAQSINPAIVVKTTYVTNDFSNAAFNDPVGGKKFGQTFITTNKPDVLFQVAGKTGNGILDAACAANIYGVGVDVDQAISYPNAAKCTITSAEKHLQIATGTVIQEIAAGAAKGGDLLFDAKTQGIGVSPGHDLAASITPDIQAKVDAAMAAMITGSLKTCPTNCGKLK